MELVGIIVLHGISIFFSFLFFSFFFFSNRNAYSIYQKKWYIQQLLLSYNNTHEETKEMGKGETIQPYSPAVPSNYP